MTVALSAWQARRAASALDRRRASLSVENLLRGVNPADLARLKQRCAEAHAGGDHRPDVFWTKYLDADAWLAKNIRIVKDLGLVENPPRDVLDLGCGGGFFWPRAARSARACSASISTPTWCSTRWSRCCVCGASPG